MLTEEQFIELLRTYFVDGVALGVRLAKEGLMIDLPRSEIRQRVNHRFEAMYKEMRH